MKLKNHHQSQKSVSLNVPALATWQAFVCPPGIVDFNSLGDNADWHTTILLNLDANWTIVVMWLKLIHIILFF